MLNASADAAKLPDALAGDSKRQLIMAGESLFARRGIEGSSLREIAVAARQGNTNAVRYHFGSREGLAQAIFEYRVAQLEPTRQRLLARADQLGRTGDLRTLLEIIALPHLLLRNDEGHFAYAGFLLQYLLYYRPRGMTHAADNAGLISPSLHRTQNLVRERLFFLPYEIADRRLLNASLMFFATLVNQENRERQANPEEYRAVLDDTLEQMVATMALPQRHATTFLDDVDPFIAP